MPAEARISPIWRKQKLFIALFFIAAGLWFIFDGAIGYPRSNERWLAHENFNKDGHLDQWPAYAREHGWVEAAPEKYHKVGDIIGQYVFGGLAEVIGLLLLIYWATQKDRLLRSDEAAVYTPSGTRVPFEAITGINKSKWEAKGIARVRYALEGRKGQFVVDDYKFDVEPTRQILEEIETRMTRRSNEAA